MNSPNDAVIKYDFHVTGKVQGVFYRQSTKMKADELGVLGWVKNNSNGSVRGVCKAEPAVLKEFKSWLSVGPPLAKVEQLDWNKSDDNVNEIILDFTVRR